MSDIIIWIFSPQIHRITANWKILLIRDELNDVDTIHLALGQHEILIQNFEIRFPQQF